MNRSAQTALSASVVKASTCSTTLDLPLQESIKQRMRRNVSPSAHTDAVVEGEREIFPNRKWHHASRVYTLKLTVCLRTLKTLYNLKTRTAPKVSLFFFIYETGDEGEIWCMMLLYMIDPRSSPRLWIAFCTKSSGHALSLSPTMSL